MKKLFIYVLFLLYISGVIIAHTYAENNTKTKILQIQGGEEIMLKIDNFILEVGKQDDAQKIYETIQPKIQALQEKFKNKNDVKSQNVFTILTYFNEEIDTSLKSISSNILKRFQKVEYDAYKNKTQLRQNKIKLQKYKRIHVKK